MSMRRARPTIWWSGWWGEEEWKARACCLAAAVSPRARQLLATHSVMSLVRAREARQPGPDSREEYSLRARGKSLPKK